MTRQQHQPTLFLSLPHACGYLPDRISTSLFLDPRRRLDSEAYGAFVARGFRRSGDFVYRPHCGECQACVPVRIPVARFRPNRGQRRIWKRNRDVTVIPRAPGFHAEHFALYLRYQARRHAGGGMDDADPEKYLNFLMARDIETLFYELRAGERLLAVAVADRLPDGLSAVYTFYDPDAPRRGLGVYAVLWQAEEARRLGLPHLYLGYWIEESPKMAYKGKYRPLEAYRDGRWAEAGFSHSGPVPGPTHRSS